MNGLSRIINFFTAIPPRVLPENYRYFNLTNAAAIGGFLGHCILFASFVFFDLQLMAVVNIGSLTLFTIVFFLNRKGQHQVGLFLAIGEIILHAVVAVWRTGMDTGFHFYLLIVPVAVFLSEPKHEHKSLVISILNIFLYIGLYLADRFVFALHPDITGNMQLYFYINNLTVTLVIIGGGAYYYKDTVRKTEAELQKAYKKITASIRYAKRIQTAILPNEKILDRLTNEHFIFFRPKDIVSGDLYWFKTLNEDKKLVISAIDCTGHGVPGGFMTMIANVLLDRLINEESVNIEPSQVLTLLRNEIIHLLKQDQNNSQDGMDMSLCVLDFEKNELQFAGAMNSIYYISEGEFHQVAATKTGIGGRPRKKTADYQTQRIALKKDMILYLYTDGFQDQFGGEKGRKFSSRRFRELLLENHRLPLPEQGEKLENTFDSWKIKEKQTDDVLVMALKI